MAAKGLNKTRDKGAVENVPNQFISFIKSIVLYSIVSIIMDIILFPVLLVKVIWAYQKEIKKEKKLKADIIS